MTSDELVLVARVATRLARASAGDLMEGMRRALQEIEQHYQTSRLFSAQLHDQTLTTPSYPIGSEWQLSPAELETLGSAIAPQVSGAPLQRITVEGWEFACLKRPQIERRFLIGFEGLEAELDQTEELESLLVLLSSNLNRIDELQEIERVRRHYEEVERIGHTGSWEWNLQTGTVWWSQELYRIYERDPDLGPLGSDWLDFVYEDDRESLKHAIQSSLETGRYRADYRQNFGGGRLKTIHAEGEVTYDSEGKPLWHRGVAVDLTRQAVIEAELRLRDQALQDAAEGIFIVDARRPGYPLVYVNPALEELLDEDSSSLIGKSCRILEGDGSDKKATSEIERALAEHRSARASLRLERPNGSQFSYEVSIAPVAGSSGRPTHYVGIVNDITDKLEAERQRQELEYELRQSQKMEVVGQLAGGVAHDFNNLLQVITGYISMLLTAPLDLESRSQVEEIELACRRAQKLIDQLLTFSRKRSFTIETIELNQVVGEACWLLARVVGRRVQVKFNRYEEPIFVEADRSMIDQIILNLGVNARDALEHEGTIEITLSVEDDRGPCQLVVSDDGAGMDPETLDRVFEPFFTTKEPGKGTGLGLSTVFGIVTRHKGTIGVESHLGAGTTVTIQLPRVAAPPGGAVAPVSESVYIYRGAVLLLESDDSVRELSRQMLERSGFQVIVTENSDEALREFQNHRAEIMLLFLDAMTPTKSGEAILKQLRSDRPDLPAVVMSGYSFDELEGIEDGESVTVFLPKPFSERDLQLSVKEALVKTQS